MNIKGLLLILFLVGITKAGYSQDYVMYISVTYSVNPWYTCSPIENLGPSIMYSEGVNQVINTASSNAELARSNGIYKGTITAGFFGSCNQTSVAASAFINIDVNGVENCTNYSATSASDELTVTVYCTILRKMAAPLVSNATCDNGTVRLTSPSSAPSYTWEVSQNLSTWHTITGKNTQSIDVTASDLSKSGFTNQNRYVRVTENGCNGRMSSPSPMFIIFLPKPTAADISSTDIRCFNTNDGTITVGNITGSVSTYGISIKDLNDPNPNSYIYQSTKSASGTPVTISTGATSVKVIINNNENMDVLGGCSIERTLTLIRPTEMNVTLNPTHINCYNVPTGAVSTTVSGGSPGYTYAWSNGGTGSSISGLSAGPYSVTVTDNKTCSKSVSTTLTQPAAPLVAAISNTVVVPSCAELNDGQLTASASGGTSGYTFTWSNGQTGSVASNLAEATYTVTVSDSKGCTDTESKFLDAPAPIQVTLVATSPSCPDGIDGSVRVSNIQNAPGPVQYLWNTNEITSEILNLRRGTYSVTVSSQNNGKTCTGSASKEVMDPTPWTAEILPALPLSFHGQAIRCNGESNGRLDVVVRNNLGNVTTGENYIWSTGASGPAKTFIDQLSEGTYDVTVTYNNICEAKDTYTLSDPEPLTPTIIPNSDFHGQVIKCRDESNGSLRVTVSGGTGASSAFTYKWSTEESSLQIFNVSAGAYDITVTDINGCTGQDIFEVSNPTQVVAEIASHSDYAGFGVTCAGEDDGFITARGVGGTGVFSYRWSNVEWDLTTRNTANINDLNKGTYTVVVTDNNGCEGTTDHVVTEPELLTLDIEQKHDISCYDGDDGFIVLKPNGGAGSYEYSMDNTAWQASPRFETLQIGDFELFVRDANACWNKTTEILTQPTALQLSFADIEPAYCEDPRGRATGVVSGGVPDYSYEWRREGLSDVLSDGPELSSVSAGVYHLYIEDAHGCLIDDVVPITSTDGAKTAFSSIDARCSYSSDGSGTVAITEGDGPFNIKWPDEQGTFQATNLKQGIYYVEVTDVHDCTVVQSVEVKAPPALQLAVTSEIIPTCNTFCDGQLSLAASGGVGNYSYEWDGMSGATQTQLCAAVYPVTIKDGNNCILQKDIALSQPDAISATLVREKLPTCKDGCDGVLEVAARGGNGDYQYAWRNGGNSNIENGICPGSYRVIVTDKKGCKGEESFVLKNTPPLPLDLGGGVTLCVGQTYELDAGPDWKTITWKSNTGLNSSEQKVVVKEPGQYWLEVFDRKNCIAQDTFLLETSTDLLKANFALSEEAHVGDTVVVVDVSWPLPDNIEWTYPEEMIKVIDEQDIFYGQFNAPGIYEVKLVAHLGECIDDMVKTITILDREGSSEDGRLGYNKFVKEFELYPNPNNGKFDVGIELLERSDITISVWSTIMPKMFVKVSGRGEKSYKHHVDIPLSAGTYILRLDHIRGREYIRFIVH